MDTTGVTETGAPGAGNTSRRNRDGSSEGLGSQDLGGIPPRRERRACSTPPERGVPSYGSKTRDATWRVVRTLENRNRRRRRRGRRWSRQRRGPRSSAGATTVGFGGKVHVGKGCLLVPSLPLLIPPEVLLLSDSKLSSGNPRCPRTCMRSSSSRYGT